MWQIRPLILLVLAMLLGPFASASGAEERNDRYESRDFVFVHGAWVGEWYWQELVDDLRSAGHQAIAVSLTGHGTRADEGGPHVSIEMHAQDVIAAIRENDLSDVILVGHSYGGRPVTAAWDKLREGVAHVVYIEAVAPVNDGPIAIPQDSQSMRFVMRKYPAWVEEGMIPVPERLHLSYAQVLSAQSLRSVYGDVALQNGALPLTPGTYIVAVDSRAEIFRRYGKRLQEWRGWRYETISGGHNIRDKGFGDLLAILLDIAGEN